MDSVTEAEDIFRGSADGDLIPGFTSARNPGALGVAKAAQLSALGGRNLGKWRWRGLWELQIMWDMWWGESKDVYDHRVFLLLQVADQLCAKYSKEYGKLCRTNQIGTVNDRVMNW